MHGSNVRMRRRSENGYSSEAPTRMLSNSGVERTRGRTDVLRYTLCTTKFIHQRGLQGDRKLVFVWEEGPDFKVIANLMVGFVFWIAKFLERRM